MFFFLQFNLIHFTSKFMLHILLILLDLGLRQPRLDGDAYLSIVDEFMKAAHARWPKAVVQVYKSSICKVYCSNPS